MKTSQIRGDTLMRDVRDDERRARDSAVAGIVDYILAGPILSAARRGKTFIEFHAHAGASCEFGFKCTAQAHFNQTWAEDIKRALVAREFDISGNRIVWKP